jgi:hypothetical protein
MSKRSAFVAFATAAMALPLVHAQGQPQAQQQALDPRSANGRRRRAGERRRGLTRRDLSPRDG